MKTIKELREEAKSYINSNPDEALKLYKTLWDSYSDKYDMWDALSTLRAMKLANSPNLHWAKQIATKFKNDKISNTYGWLIFKKCIKSKNKKEIIAYEEFIKDLNILAPQKNLKENDTSLCLTTISIFKICDAYSENLFNAKKINEFLSLLNYNFLSDTPKNINTQNRGEIEVLSDLEKFFLLKTKALLKLNEFNACIEYCNIGLKLIKKFHSNTDLWLKMRIAISEEKLGNHKKSEELFQELLNSKAGSDKWFLYKNLSEVYFEQKNYEKAWEYAVNASFYGKDPHYLIGLYLIQARILYKLNRASEGKILAELIAAILNEKNWKEKVEYQKLFSYYKIDRTKIGSVNEIIKQARLFWQKEKYGNKTISKGTIIFVHKNGKEGKIKNTNNNIIEFSKKDFVKMQKSLENLKGATVKFFTIDFNGKKKAENISIIQVPPKQNLDYLIGKTYDGIVQKIEKFGIFIKIEKSIIGLLHKNSLPLHLKNNFNEVFTKGMHIKVKVENITNNKINFTLIDNL